jgi:hypothetical protein
VEEGRDEAQKSEGRHHQSKHEDEEHDLHRGPEKVERLYTVVPGQRSAVLRHFMPRIGARDWYSGELFTPVIPPSARGPSVRTPHGGFLLLVESSLFFRAGSCFDP